MSTSTTPVSAWTRLLGTATYQAARALTTGADGAIYVAGYTESNLEGQSYSGGSSDAFITKYNPDGTKVWTRLLGTTAGDNARALTTGADGAIYVAGYTEGNLDGQISSGGGDGFITKYDGDGTKLWTRLLTTTIAETALALTTGADGAIYVAGYTEGNLDGQTNRGGADAFITKYNADGTKVWTRLLGTTSYDKAYALTTGNDGAIYVAGNTWGNLDGQTYSGGSDAFLSKWLTESTTPAATYSISPLQASINEGSIATFTVTTTNVASGTSLAYTLSGVSASDITGGSISGTTTVGSNGQATISVPIAVDHMTEGNETLTVTVQGKTASTTIVDSSLTSQPTYSIQPAALAFN